VRRMSTKNVPAPELTNLSGSKADNFRYREVAAAVSSHEGCDQSRSV